VRTSPVAAARSGALPHSRVLGQRATRRADGALLSVEPAVSERRDPQTALPERVRELAQTRVRFGYRRLLVLLRRIGWDVWKRRLYGVSTQEGLALRRKRLGDMRRRCIASSRGRRQTSKRASGCSAPRAVIGSRQWRQAIDRLPHENPNSELNPSTQALPHGITDSLPSKPRVGGSRPPGRAIS
jgi:hypothetical protein